MMTYGGHMAGYGLLGGVWGWLIGLGIVVILGAVIYFAISNNRRGTSTSDALEILKIKFAQGEISIEEYQNRKNVLSGK